MLRRIDEFCPEGMQIRSPGGLVFDPEEIASMEAFGGREGSLTLSFKGGKVVTITFYENTDGDAPNVYGLMRNIKDHK